MGKWFSFFTVMIVVLVTVRPGVAVAEVGGAASTIIINEIQVNGDGAQPQFVELVNITAQPVDLAGWVMEYAKPAFAPELCGAADWQAGASTGAAHGFELSGTVVANGVLAFDPPASTISKTTAGSLRLLSPESGGVRIQHDLVGWGTAPAPAPCKEVAQAPLPSKSKSLQRYVECDAGPVIDTNNNQLDFGVATQPSPAAPNLLQSETCGPEIPQPACSGAVISEILPNPAGADLGKEFIELFNPTAAVIPLAGCQLGLGDAMKPYTFASEMTLQPEEYRAFSDEVTAFTLPNTAGGEVVLINGTAEHTFSYPAAMKDDESWASVSGLWQATNVPTPGAANKPAAPKVEGGHGTGDEELAPCPNGKFRNPLTNRCKSLAAVASSSAGLTPCQAGQTRNPQTNRCRSAVTASASLTPCQSGQERNPATNRCRSVLATSTTLKPCDEGEERNPETNRCRKVATTLASTTPAPGKEGKGTSRLNYGILGLVGISVLGYGAYEYRNDFRNKFAILKSRLGKKG